jgi:hypothetical protein
MYTFVIHSDVQCGKTLLLQLPKQHGDVLILIYHKQIGIK